MELSQSHAELLRLLIRRVALIGLARAGVGARRRTFPLPVHTLDALHLASAEFLRSQNQVVIMATYDEKMRRAAERMSIPLIDLP